MCSTYLSPGNLTHLEDSSLLRSIMPLSRLLQKSNTPTPSFPGARWGGGGVGGCKKNVSHFFIVENQLAHTNSTLYARITPQWLTEPRWLWLSVPWQIAHELVSLIGSNTMPGQHIRPTDLVEGVCVFNIITRDKTSETLIPTINFTWHASKMYGKFSSINYQAQQRVGVLSSVSHKGLYRGWQMLQHYIIYCG